MNLIPDKEDKMRLLWRLYYGYRERMKFVEFVEKQSRERPDFFRWITGNEQIEDYGRNLKETTRMMLVTAMV